jgi:hypothetical protein
MKKKKKKSQQSRHGGDPALLRTLEQHAAVLAKLTRRVVTHSPAVEIEISILRDFPGDAALSGSAVTAVCVWRNTFFFAFVLASHNFELIHPLTNAHHSFLPYATMCNNWDLRNIDSPPTGRETRTCFWRCFSSVNTFATSARCGPTPGACR